MSPEIRDYQILHWEHAYIVTARSLQHTDVIDVINTFAGTEAGLQAARDYILEVQDHQAEMGRT